MKFFRLKEGVFFVKGALRGALLNTCNQQVYSVNEEAVRILCGESENAEYWQRLIVLGLAEESASFVPIQPPPSTKDFSLDFVWFEINGSDCNESCIQCYVGSLPRSLATKRSGKRLRLAFGDWSSLLSQTFELGCRCGQFIGGEPFLYQDGHKGVLDLAEYARNLGFSKVEVFTNATLLTRQKVQRIKDLGLEIAVTLYSCNPVIHDQITKTPGSHRKTVSALRLLKEAEVKTRVEVVVVKQNQETVAQTLEFIQRLGFQGRKPDPLRPTGRGVDPLIQPSEEILARYGLMLEPRFWVKEGSLKRNCSGNSCLAGKAVITEDGDVLPCIFSREQVVGNVTKQPLREIILGESLQKIWHTTKDSVLVCKDCEYHYVCLDCRPLSSASAGGRSDYFSAPFPRCTYNPYTGEWGEGIWQIDKDGRPYYDTIIASVIRSVCS